MTIIEQAVTAKTNPRECEDTIVVTDDFVAVVDGSTSKSPTRIDPEVSDGRLCMTVVADFISHMPATMTVGRFCLDVTAAVYNIYVSRARDTKTLLTNPTHRMAASCVVYSRHRHEVWMIGDCQCIVDGRLYDNPKPYEQHVADIRADHIHRLFSEARAAGKSAQQLTDELMTDDSGRRAAIGELIRQCAYQNVTFAVIDGYTLPLGHVRVISTATGSPTQEQQIVMASDGYPLLLPTLRQSEEALAQQLARDPLCIDTFRATKGLMHGRCSFDDRSYIRFLP